MDSIKSALSPRPSVAIVKIFPGQVEIGIRIAAVVLALLVFIPGAVLNGSVQLETFENAGDLNDGIKKTKISSEWIIVVCWMAFLVHMAAVLLRFMNFSIVEKYIGLLLIVEAVICGMFTISWFVGAIFFAIRSIRWIDLAKEHELLQDQIAFSTIKSSCAATSTFCFFSVLVESTLLLWLILWLLLNWQKQLVSQIRYEPGPTNKDTAPENYN